MIEVLPRSSGNTLGVRLGGRVTLDEYRDVFVAEITHRVEEHGRYRLLILADEDFEGFAEEVALEDPAYGLAHRQFALERLAVIGAGPRFNLGATFVGHLASEWVRAFPHVGLEAAWAWVEEHDAGSDAVVSLAKVIGADVVDHLGEPLGTVDDVVVDAATGSVRLVVVAFGGFLGLGEKLHPFPWRLFHCRPDGTLVLRLHEIDKSRDELEHAPAVERGHAWRPDPRTYGFATHPFFRGSGA